MLSRQEPQENRINKPQKPYSQSEAYHRNKQPEVNMKVTIAFLSLLAAVAMASPANVNNPLEARFDCNTCGCSSTDACTVSCPAVLPLAL